LVRLANRRIQPLCHLSAVWFQQLTTELPILWWLNGGLRQLEGGKLPPEGLSAMNTSPNFNSNPSIRGLRPLEIGRGKFRPIKVARVTRDPVF